MSHYIPFVTDDGYHIGMMKSSSATPADADWDNQDNVILLAGQSKIKSLWSFESTTEAFDFDGSDVAATDQGSSWSNVTNMDDADDLTEGTTATTGSSSADYVEVQGTGAPASGDTINSVQVMIRVAESGADAVLGVRVTTDAAGETLLDTTQALTTTSSDYFFSLSTPSGGWTWAKIQALEVRYWRDSGSTTLEVARGQVIVDIATEGDYHVATQQENGRVAYHVFDPGTDAWTTRDEYVDSVGEHATFDQVPEFHGASLALRSDGDVVIAYPVGDTITTADTLVYSRREGGTWTRGVVVSAISSSDQKGVATIGPATDDRITFVYAGGSNTVTTRSLDSSNVLGTATPVNGESDTAQFRVGPGVIDSADLITVPYIDASNDVSTAQWTSAAAPSAPSIKADVSDKNVLGHGTGYTTQEVTGASSTQSISGGSGSDEKHAMSFKVNKSVEVQSITVDLLKENTPTDNTEISIQTDSSGDPSSTKLATGVISSASLATTIAAYRFETLVFLEEGVLYWIVIERSGTRDVTNRAGVSLDTANPYADGQHKELSSGTWTIVSASWDLGFSVDDVQELGSVACLALDGTDVHLIYSDDDVTTPTFDLFHDDDASVAGGGTETEVEDAVTAIRVSMLKGVSDLLYVFDDDGTLKFNKIVLAAPAPGGYPEALFTRPKTYIRM